MAYIRERSDGTSAVHPHKLRAMLKNKIAELLTRYSLDEVLSEVAAQRPSFDIRICPAKTYAVPGTKPEEAQETVEA
jgi:hypothetical protein